MTARSLRKDFKNFGLVTNPTTLKPNVLVCWEALGIDPLTLSPQMLLNVAEVVQVNSKTVTVRMLSEHETVTVGFGLREGVTGAEGEELEDEVVELDIADIVGWKLVGRT